MSNNLMNGLKSMTVANVEVASEEAKAFLFYQSRMTAEDRTFEDINNYFKSILAMESLKDLYTIYNIHQMDIFKNSCFEPFTVGDKNITVCFSYDLPYESSLGKPHSVKGKPKGWYFKVDGVDSGFGFFPTCEAVLDFIALL